MSSIRSSKPLRDSEVPFWERFFLGGERNIRGYEIYTIGPRDASGTNVGGMKQFVINAEYILHVGGQDSPLYLIAFHDRGNAYARYGKVSWKDMYYVHGPGSPDLRPGPEGSLPADFFV